MKKKLLIIPICALVLVCGFMITAKAKRSNAAADGLTQNELSADGFRREDLKAVYRDITTNRFANDKTAEVIKHSVPGVEIPQHEPTPEEISALLNSNINAWCGSHTNVDVEYRTEYKYQPGGEYDILDKITVECLRGGEALWETDFLALDNEWEYIDNCIMTSAGTAVWGHRYHWLEDTTATGVNNLCYSRIARVDDSGCKLWEREINHGFDHEYIKAVIDNGDGTWAVIINGDYEYLCLSQFDIDGNEISFTKTKVDRMAILNAARLGDGYLVQTQRVCADWDTYGGGSAGGGRSGLVKLDHDGNVTDSFIYKSDDCDYYITNMTEFEGNVYLSAYAVPKQTDEGGRHEIANILDYVFDGKHWEISSEELTPMVRDNYTAVLLLCNPNEGEPKTFYSVKGSLGGALAVEDGQLKWNVESITSTFFSPATSSFTIGGMCMVYRYSFDENGILAGCEDTGKAVRFGR